MKWKVYDSGSIVDLTGHKNDWFKGIMQSEGQRERRIRKSEQIFREMWDTIMYTNIYGVPEGEKREKRYLKK